MGNMRLNTSQLDTEQLVKAYRGKHMSLNEAMALPEQAHWSSSTGYHCASLVVELWRAAGLFGDLSITPNESHIRDVYQMAVFPSTGHSTCTTIVNGQLFSYCFLQGKSKFALEGFNSISLYGHMNEHCHLHRKHS